MLTDAINGQKDKNQNRNPTRHLLKKGGMMRGSALTRASTWLSPCVSIRYRLGVRDVEVWGEDRI